MLFGKKEIPQEVLTPDYWKGHSFEDSCHWTRRILGNPTMSELIWREKRENDEAKRRPKAYEILRQAAQGESQVVSSLESGVFNGLDYPEGTIVRIHRERLTRDRNVPFKGILRELLNGNLLRGWVNFSGLSYWENPQYFLTVHIGVLMESVAYPTLHRMRIMRASEVALQDNMPHAKRPFDERAYIKIGEVEHSRFLDDILDLTGSETLERVKRLEILEI